jgi:hypothetical protein
VKLYKCDIQGHHFLGFFTHKKNTQAHGKKKRKKKKKKKKKILSPFCKQQHLIGTSYMTLNLVGSSI